MNTEKVWKQMSKSHGIHCNRANPNDMYINEVNIRYPKVTPVIVQHSDIET